MVIKLYVVYDVLRVNDAGGSDVFFLLRMLEACTPSRKREARKFVINRKGPSYMFPSHGLLATPAVVKVVTCYKITLTRGAC